MFGSTSTAVFGQPSSPLALTPAFGVSPTPAFRASPSPPFGALSTPACRASSPSTFGGSSTFGAKLAFGDFGSTSSRMSSFGSTFQQTQPASGGSLFASTTPFGASQPAFGASGTPSFGSKDTLAFGATSAPEFGSTSAPAFGATSAPAFGSTSSLFGSTGSTFGVSGSPAFGSTPTFGVPFTSNFGSSNSPALGASSTPSFGSWSVPTFGASSGPSFGFSSAPSFGQSTSAVGSTPFGSASTFGTQCSLSGIQTSTFGSPSFGKQSFGGQQVGSKISAYAPTLEVDSGTATQAAGRLVSISAMPVHEEKSHEELRWGDFQLGDKGGASSVGQAASAFSFPSAQTSPFDSTKTLGQTPAFCSAATNPFCQKLAFGSTGFGASLTSSFSSPFGVSSSSPFGSTTASPTPSNLSGASSTPTFGANSTFSFGASSTPVFGTSLAPTFGTTSAPAFGTSCTPVFGASATSAFGSSSASSSTAATTPAFRLSVIFGGTQSSGMFQSSSSIGQTSSLYGKQNTGFGQSTSTFGSSIVAIPSTGFGGGLFSSSTSSPVSSNSPFGFSQSNPSFSSPLELVAATQTSRTFSFAGVGQAQPGIGSFDRMSSGFNLGTLGQLGVTQSTAVMQPATVGNPFGALPAMPHMSIRCAGSTPSVHYGISNLPVADKHVPVRISSLSTPRHLSQRRIKLPARKYHPKTDGSPVPFFTEEEEYPSTSKPDPLFISRENPRALIIHPTEKWPSRSSTERKFMPNESTPVSENGKATEEPSPPASNGTFTEDHTGKATKEPSPPWNGTFAEDHAGAQDTNGFSREQNNTPVLPKPMQKQGDLPGDLSQKRAQPCYNIVSGHSAGDAVVIYAHGADTDALMPRLSHPEYYTEPRIEELAAEEQAHGGFICHVRDFLVGRDGYGSIKFDGETDVRRLDLDSIIQFNHREVIVYKDENRKPPVGQGLNKPAVVTLLNVKCVNRKAGKQYTEGAKVEQYKEMLIRKAEEQGAEFVSYDAAKGEWKFRVEHFSCYNFENEELDALPR